MDLPDSGPGAVLVGGGGGERLLVPGHRPVLVMVGDGGGAVLSLLLGHCLLPGLHLDLHGGGGGGAQGFLLRHNVFRQIQLDISLELVTFDY